MGPVSPWLLALNVSLTAGDGLDPKPTQRADEVLTLDEVLESTRLHYPPLLAAIQEIEEAEGKRRSVNGKFDTNLVFGGAADQFGFYENYRLDFGVEQAVQFWGAKLYAGWRTGQGGFAPYSGLQETRDGGEYRAGIKLPLLNGRAIDDSRAKLQRADLGVRLAELSVLEQALLIRQLATWAYWDWVVAGQSLEVVRRLLDIAVARDEFLRESVDAGALPAIEVTDNRRAILKRRSSFIAAERKLRKAGIYLSLYYRDRVGEPVVPEDTRLPVSFPDPSPLAVGGTADDVEQALQRRPELKSLRTQASQVEIDESLAANLGLPSLDLSLGGTAEVGENEDVKRGPSELKAGLVFTLPVQRREANGLRAAARAKLQRIRQKERFLTEKIEAEVRDALIALDVSYQQTEILDEEVEVTRELEQLERERFQLGDSNLFTVNLRETSTADAEKRLIEALATYHRARALYELVIAAP